MKYVLFVCVANAGRSIMAQAIFNDRKRYCQPVGARYYAISTGTNPASQIGTVSSQVLEEIGIRVNPEIHYPKPVTEEMLKGAARIICLDGNITSSDLFGYVPHENWDIRDTYHQDADTIRKIRDEIAVRVADLTDELFRIEIGY